VTAVPLVGLARLYVGAHLPLDMAGGAGLGLAVEALVSLTASGDRHACGTSRRRTTQVSDILLGLWPCCWSGRLS